MALCTTLQSRVLNLEKTKTTQQNEIDSLKRRVNKLKKKKSSRTHKVKRLYKVGLSARVESFGDEKSLGEDASKQGRRINAIDSDEDITLVNVQDDADNEMFDVDALNGEEVFVAGGVWMHPRFVLYSMDYDIMIFGYLVTDDWVQSTSFTTDFGAHDSMVTLI
ncbi:hypothetical protein Tco_1054094 [Tanacetum coccineum]|uniref:Uncharacterized protein n=1 Tax=Tanacetum coccineum TaxID=301880 RepID=A0ABQ5GXN3_9ASTR